MFSRWRLPDIDNIPVENILRTICESPVRNRPTPVSVAERKVAPPAAGARKHHARQRTIAFHNFQ